MGSTHKTAGRPSKKCSRCGIEKSISEFGVHASKGDGHNAFCKECHRAYYAVYREEHATEIHRDAARFRDGHRELVRARTRAWMEAHPEKQRAAEIAYRKNNTDKRRESCAKYRDANPEKEKVYRRKYCESHRAELTFKSSQRRAAKFKATPKWADESKIEAMYIKAREISKSLGKTYEVDHIVPLKSPVVCGLHCEQNLRIICASENRRKGNRRWPKTQLEATEYVSDPIIKGFEP